VHNRRDGARRGNYVGGSNASSAESGGTATDLAVDAAIAGVGIILLFDDRLRPYFDSGAREPVLEPWRQRFSGPFLCNSGPRLVPAPLRASIDFV
jgi:hypothetical protein